MNTWRTINSYDGIGKIKDLSGNIILEGSTYHIEKQEEFISYPGIEIPSNRIRFIGTIDTILPIGAMYCLILQGEEILNFLVKSSLGDVVFTGELIGD